MPDIHDDLRAMVARWRRAITVCADVARMADTRAGGRDMDMRVLTLDECAKGIEAVVAKHEARIADDVLNPPGLYEPVL